MIPNIPYSNKTILICPLDWGMGHAARCVPLIKQLQAQNNRVIIGCTGWQKDFLQKEVSNAEYADLFGYNVTYSEKISLGLKILWQAPRLSMLVKKEHAWLHGLLKKHKIDVVISDNRFGLYSAAVESIFITHQIFVRAPFLQSAVNGLNMGFIKRFNACWVPDHEEKEKSLSGDLSHGYTLPIPIIFIGPLSRFESGEKKLEKKFDMLVLLSGVEPQRSVLEEKLVKALASSPYKVALVRGAQKNEKKFPANFSVTDTASTKQLEELFLCSEKIICRSGYSTLMDLHALGLKAFLVPTPGQTEQEYLAEYWKEKFGFDLIRQDDISRESLLERLGLKEDPQPQRSFV